MLVDPSGQAQVAGAGSAYFLRATHKPEVCRPGAPLTFRGVEERETRAGDRFDLLSWTGKGGTGSFLTAESASVRSYPGRAGGVQ